MLGSDKIASLEGRPSLRRKELSGYISKLLFPSCCWKQEKIFFLIFHSDKLVGLLEVKHTVVGQGDPLRLSPRSFNLSDMLIFSRWSPNLCVLSMLQVGRDAILPVCLTRFRSGGLLYHLTSLTDIGRVIDFTFFQPIFLFWG